MKKKVNLFHCACVALIALGASSTSRAKTIMDQIGTSGSFFTGDNAYTSQAFGGSNAGYNIAAVDDFNTTGPTELTNVSVALLGFDGFTSYSDITGYGVEIYSSASAAASSLTGDVAHQSLGPAKATVTEPFSGDAGSALVSLPVTITLTTAGTYYVAVIAALPFADGEVGVYGSTGLTGSNPGGVNGFQTNPSGSFGLPGNEQADAVDMAYRITAAAVPEPSSWALLAVGGSVAVLAVQRRRRHV